MTEQQGWTGPPADQAAEGAAAAPQHTMSPHAPTAGIPHRAAPVSGAGYPGPAQSSPTSGAAHFAPTSDAADFAPTSGAEHSATTSDADRFALGAGPVYPAPASVTGNFTTPPVPYGGHYDTPGGGPHLPPHQPMPPHAPQLTMPSYSVATAHEAPTHTPHRRSRVGIAIAAALAAIALSGGSAVAGGYAVTRFDSKASSSTISAVSASRSNGSGTTSLSDVAAAVLPSVVSINTGTAIGSGVVLSANGNVLTNNHVVATARGNTVQVAFSDGSTGTATIVGTDPTHDLAVIKVQGVSKLTPITFADSGAVKVGDTVLAVGSPLGLSGSVTEGIVSALNRTIDESSASGGSGASIGGAIQTDAAINPGNSGGALVNSAGQLIGINTAIASATQQEAGNIGVGFAISSNTAKQAANKILGT
jgi:putative serine protease PepD